MAFALIVVGWLALLAVLAGIAEWWDQRQRNGRGPRRVDPRYFRGR